MDGHEPEDVHAEFFESGEIGGEGVEGALGGVLAGVHLIDDELINCCLSSGIDGVVAGDTVRSISDNSGEDLLQRNLEFVKYISRISNGLLPIIGVGGIMNGEGAMQMMDAGAILVEVFTGIFREGPSIVNDIVSYISAQERVKA